MIALFTLIFMGAAYGLQQKQLRGTVACNCCSFLQDHNHPPSPRLIFQAKLRQTMPTLTVSPPAVRAGIRLMAGATWLPLKRCLGLTRSFSVRAHMASWPLFPPPPTSRLYSITTTILDGSLTTRGLVCMTSPPRAHSSGRTARPRRSRTGQPISLTMPLAVSTVWRPTAMVPGTIRTALLASRASASTQQPSPLWNLVRTITTYHLCEDMTNSNLTVSLYLDKIPFSCRQLPRRIPLHVRRLLPGQHGGPALDYRQ
jgi:hypothetical protein